MGNKSSSRSEDSTDFAAQGLFDFSNIQQYRWTNAHKCHHFFATQYDQSLVFYGTTADNGTTSIEERGADKYLLCGMGCVVTLVDGVDAVDKYVWSLLPQLKERLPRDADTLDEINKTRRVYGGYAVRAQIRMFCSVPLLEGINAGYPKCWTTPLSGPSEGPSLCIDWSEDTTQRVGLTDYQCLLVMQHCGRYDVYFYETHFCIISGNSDEYLFCCFSPSDDHHFNQHAKCVLLNDDLVIISGNKMAKIENVRTCLSPRTVRTGRTTETTRVVFNKSVPYINSTPFAVNNILFTVGGCDQLAAPFSEIMEYFPIEDKWNCIGRSAVGRYGATVVVFTDKNTEQAVFIAGGFFDETTACSIIEKVPVVRRGKKRSTEEAELHFE